MPPPLKGTPRSSAVFLKSEDKVFARTEIAGARNFVLESQAPAKTAFPELVEVLGPDKKYYSQIDHIRAGLKHLAKKRPDVWKLLNQRAEDCRLKPPPPPALGYRQNLAPKGILQ